MQYSDFNAFKKAWAFKRDDPKIPTEDLEKIRVLSEEFSNNIWRDYVSKEQLHPDHLTPNDWLKMENHQMGRAHWESCWDSEDHSLPDEVLQHVGHWGDDTVVFFCYHSDEVIETTWVVFSRYWKNFLFFDNGPILFGKKKKQAIQFFSNGQCQLLSRS
ncbi:DUF2947 family protein [Marinomonas algicola]|uniref:DUF2947 family protein n=1 Tax=Marinomonas algicola TaxID=2773454 RepID=UPI001749535B|nr:DUF2947 family protein [Marinomonas algicola]